MAWEASRSAILIEATFDGSAEHVVALPYRVASARWALNLSMARSTVLRCLLVLGLELGRPPAVAAPTQPVGGQLRQDPGVAEAGEQEQREH